MRTITEPKARADLKIKLVRQMVVMCQLALLLLGLGVIAKPDLSADHSSHPQAVADRLLAIQHGDRRDEIRVFFTTEKRTVKKWRFEPQHDVLAAASFKWHRPFSFVLSPHGANPGQYAAKATLVYHPRAPPSFLI